MPGGWTLEAKTQWLRLQDELEEAISRANAMIETSRLALKADKADAAAPVGETLGAVKEQLDRLLQAQQAFRSQVAEAQSAQLDPATRGKVH